MKRNIQMMLVFAILLSVGCVDNEEIVIVPEPNLIEDYYGIEGHLEVEDYSEIEVVSELVTYIPPWQVGYIEDLQNFNTQTQFSYETIIPFGRYNWITIGDEFIIATKIEHDGRPPDDYGNFYSDSLSYYSALLNLDGDYIAPFGAINGRIQVGDNFVVVHDNQGNSGVYDFEGNLIIPTGRYQHIGEIYNNIAIVGNYEGWGAVDFDDNIIIPFGLYRPIWFQGRGGNLFLVEEPVSGNTQRRGVLDLEENTIIEPGQFQSIGSIHVEHGVIVVGRPSTGGFIGVSLFNIETGEVTSFSSAVRRPNDSLTVVGSDRIMTSRGIFDFNGERISPENITFHLPIHDNERRFFTISQDNKNGIYNVHTNEVFWLGSGLRLGPLVYPLVIASKGSILNSAVLDFYGQEVIPFGTHYRIDRILGENRFLIRMDENDRQSNTLVNASGQEIIPPRKFGYLERIWRTNFLWTDYCDFFDEASGVVDFNGQVIFPQHEYLFRGHWGLQIDPYTGFASEHFFAIQDPNNSMALIRLKEIE